MCQQKSNKKTIHEDLKNGFIICINCNIKKDLSEFSFSCKGHYDHKCKKCVAERRKEIKYNRNKTRICNWCKEQKDKIKDFNSLYQKICINCLKIGELNKEQRNNDRKNEINGKAIKKCKICNNIKKARKNGKSFRYNCQFCINERQYKRRIQNRNIENLQQRQYRNRPEIKRKQSRQRKNRRKIDSSYRLKESLRARIRIAIKTQNKITKSFLDLIGCSINLLKNHLENQFTNGMNWQNYGYGNNKWNIGHILPCSLFNLINLDEQKICFNYKNLKPQWQSENFSESDRLDNNKQAYLLNRLEKLEYLKSKGYDLFYLYHDLINSK